MAALGIQGNGESGSAITEEAIDKTLKSLENNLQRVGFNSHLHPLGTKRYFMFWPYKFMILFWTTLLQNLIH